MINRKVLYFYEYASEIRGRCLGHARLLVCGHVLKITLAFSLPEWEKKNCELYLVAENNQGKTVALLLGEIMPCDIMTVYNLDVKEEKLEGMSICSIIHVGLMVRECKDRYIKAVSGIFDITSRSLDMLLDEQGREYDVKEETEPKKEKNEPQKTEPVQEECEKYESGEKQCEQPEFSRQREPEPYQQSGLGRQYEPQSRESETCASQRYECNEKVPMNTGRDMSEKEVITLKSHVEKLMALRPEYKPFGAGRISYSVRIGIGDVIGLSEHEPGLKDNSFLLHGFYKYKHILLASSMVRGHMNYYILVPGVKVEREQRVADMYGFHEFISLDGQTAKTGTFGYYSWLLPS